MLRPNAATCFLATLGLTASAALSPPTTLLGGFLGTGKTTALTHMLTNRDGLRIAVLVNDVASVNVDAATVRAATVSLDPKAGNVEMIELENGCVCCGPSAGELAPAVRALSERRDGSGAALFDHVVVELSGVADPTNVQSNLNAGGVAVNHKVALVDANAFPAMYNSNADMGDRRDLAGPEIDADPCAVDRRVVELLLLQIETADVILVNKVDVASPDELRTTLAACRVLNADARICSTTFGNAELGELLPLERELAATTDAATCSKPGGADAAHEHSHHEHSHAERKRSRGGSSTECADAACTDPNHDHSHHEPVHGHSHHEHSHEEGASACNDPLCTDPSHNHDPAAVPNSAESLGFTTYTYTSRRPFKQQRLASMVLQRWPLPTKPVLTLDTLASPGAAAVEEAGATGGLKDATFANVLRSKGVAWLDQQHRIQASWSHAGRQFQLAPSGQWWATLPDEIVRAALSSDGVTKEPSAAYEAERRTFDGPWGDRRNELVFIGTNLDTGAIKAALDECLVTDEEMEEYRAIWSVDEERLASQNGPFRFEVGTNCSRLLLSASD